MFHIEEATRSLYTRVRKSMKFELQLSPRLEQKQMMTLTPLLIQRFQMLRQPYEGLLEKANAEVEKNVFLEFSREDVLLRQTRASASVTGTFQDEFLENRADPKYVSLQSHLLEQLEWKGFDEPDRSIVEHLIGSLDERGYLRDYPRLKEKLMAQFDVSRVKIDQALELLQDFEPEGVGARTLKECLLLQIEAYQFDSEDLRKLLDQTVRFHLDDIARKAYDKIAVALKIPSEGVPALAGFIETNLTPNPGARYASETDNRYVIPSFRVRKDGAQFRIDNLEATQGFQLSLSAKYLQMLDSPGTDEKTKTYLKEQLQAAKDFIGHMEQRGSTLEQIAKLLESSQHDFFARGIHWLAPLQQSDVARQIHVHPSTVSRAIAEKFIETPHGLYSVKTLLPRSVSGYSVQFIKRRMVDMVAEHVDWSDRHLMQALNHDGINIKRRTVNKYRNELITDGRLGAEVAAAAQARLAGNRVQ